LLAGNRAAAESDLIVVVVAYGTHTGQGSTAGEFGQYVDAFDVLVIWNFPADPRKRYTIRHCPAMAPSNQPTNRIIYYM
jgi:hypothetical protein